ncbi:MAG: hypothetical protein ABIX01_20620 [Chitinophagaceae bacterium]
MSDHTTISALPPAEMDMNFALLRSEGLKHIESMSQALWTDYNVHDPGVTILELLCYAITDLGYRTSMPIEDLLSVADKNEDNFKSQFYSAKQILPSRPVSELDYRKLFIDLPGIKNAWIFKGKETLFVDLKQQSLSGKQPAHPRFRTFDLNGLYSIKIEPDDMLVEETCDDKAVTDEEKKAKQLATEAIKTRLVADIKEVFHRNRNLCEDLLDIAVIKEQKIRVCTDIEISPQADAAQVYAEVLYAISNYLSPSIRQYTLAEMIAMKKEDGSAYTMDEIFNGPVLQHGFMKDEDVIASGIRTVIYASDIINLLMDIDGVVAVKKFLFNYCDLDGVADRHEWCLPIPTGKKPGLCICKSAIHFYKDIIPVKMKKQDALKLFYARLKNEQQQAVTYDDQLYPVGVFQDTETYTSIMQHLPLTYGVGDYGLPTSAPEDRKAMAKQLKAYLLFYDQVLANYLSQLTHVKENLSVSQPLFSNTPQTYYYQKIAGVNDIDQIIKGYADFEKPGNALASAVKLYDDVAERKNRFMDHLLARFAENFNAFVLQLYSHSGQKTPDELLLNKIIFLNEYPAISRDRGAGYDYFNTNDDNGPVGVWDTKNVSGMAHRLSRLLGIANYQRRTLSAFNPVLKSDTDGGGVTSFSFRVEDPKDGKLLISSNTKFADEATAAAAWISMVERGTDAGNYQLKTSVDGKFFFTINDAAGNVIARRLGLLKTKEEAQQAITYLQYFIKENYSDEGMHVVEHILLRPDLTFLTEKNELDKRDHFFKICQDGDCKDGCEDDPYSFRVTVILPADSARFTDFDFRTYIEKVVRTETPAHVYPRVCWWSREDLAVFEPLYKKWLEAKQAGALNTTAGLQLAADLIKTLNERKSSYPPGNLDDDKDPVDNPVILGRTHIGKPKI